MNKKTAITEKDNMQDQWYKEAREQTTETIGDFIKKLCTEYSHDYGTICHAITAAAVAAAYAVDSSPQGGITGFQAGQINLQFLNHWGGYKPPFGVRLYKDLLYPQYEYKFTSITPDIWEWLQKEAIASLDSGENLHERVRSHMQSIAAGKVPFGLKVSDE